MPALHYAGIAIERYLLDACATPKAAGDERARPPPCPPPPLRRAAAAAGEDVVAGAPRLPDLASRPMRDERLPSGPRPPTPFLAPRPPSAVREDPTGGSSPSSPRRASAPRPAGRRARLAAPLSDARDDAATPSSAKTRTSFDDEDGGARRKKRRRRASLLDDFRRRLTLESPPRSAISRAA